MSTSTLNTQSHSQSPSLGFSLKEDFVAAKKFKAGETLPFSFEVQGNIIQISPENVGTVRVVHDFFVQASESDLLFSVDGKEWSDFTDFFTGNLGFSLNMMDANPTIQGLLVANLRNSA